MRNMKNKKTILITLVVIAIIVGIAFYIEFNLVEVILALPEFFRFLIFDFLPPSFNNWQDYIEPILDTLYFAILATFISAVISFAISFIANENGKVFKVISYVIKLFAAIIRNIPVLVWASLLVLVFGIGKIPGLFSLVIFDIGFLIRSYSEALEEMDSSSLEYLRSSGVNPLTQIVRGKIPLFMPSFYSWTLFIFEINIRASTILGIVGAGGLGVKLKEATGVFRYHEAATIIILMIIMILGVEAITNKVKVVMK